MTLLDYMFESGGMILFGLIIPGIVTAFVFYALFKLVSMMFADASTSSRTGYRSSNVRTNQSGSYVKNPKYAQIDRVLSDYFRNHASLILFDNISISTQSGTYTTVDNLYISYFDEKICQLKEFKSYYPDAYDKVISALAKLSQQSTATNIREEKKKKNAKIKGKEKQKEQVQEPVKEEKKPFSDAEKYIDQINRLNSGLSNEEVTNGLYQTCELLKQIDIVDREDGTVDPKLNKLYEYYLPILIGILENYKRLSDSAVKGDEFKKCETQLVKTIKLINEALKTIYNSLHESDYMNLSADINTLQSLLKQDGLVETPFKEVK